MSAAPIEIDEDQEISLGLLFYENMLGLVGLGESLSEAEKQAVLFTQYQIAKAYLKAPLSEQHDVLDESITKLNTVEATIQELRSRLQARKESLPALATD